MRIEETALPGVRLLHATPHGDARGLFVEHYSRQAFADVGVTDTFVQDAMSRSGPVGTVRGLHFQAAPCAQAKLVRVLKGRVYDVVLDMRPSSATFGQHLGFDLQEDDWKTVYIPEGCAHGFCTLAPDTEIAYKLSSEYSPAHAGGVLWNDPALGIEWPVDAAQAHLSDRDQAWPCLADMPPAFE